MSPHRISAVLGLSICLLAAGAAEGKKGKDARTEPGTYTDWNDEIDRLEVVETFRRADYSRLAVGAFTTEDVALPDADDNTYEPVTRVLADVAGPLAAGLGEKSPGLKVETGATGGPAEPGTLLLRGRVLEMDPGSRAARYWAGFGAGAARTKLEGEIVDAASGKVLLRFTQERRSGVGMGGGKYDKLLERNLRAIGEDLAMILGEF